MLQYASRRVIKPHCLFCFLFFSWLFCVNIYKKACIINPACNYCHYDLTHLKLVCVNCFDGIALIHCLLHLNVVCCFPPCPPPLPPTPHKPLPLCLPCTPFISFLPNHPPPSIQSAFGCTWFSLPSSLAPSPFHSSLNSVNSSDSRGSSGSHSHSPSSSSSSSSSHHLFHHHHPRHRYRSSTLPQQTPARLPSISSHDSGFISSSQDQYTSSKSSSPLPADKKVRRNPSDVHTWP